VRETSQAQGRGLARRNTGPGRRDGPTHVTGKKSCDCVGTAGGIIVFYRIRESSVSATSGSGPPNNPTAVGSPCWAHWRRCCGVSALQMVTMDEVSGTACALQ